MSNGNIGGYGGFGSYGAQLASNNLQAQYNSAMSQQAMSQQAIHQRIMAQAYAQQQNIKPKKFMIEGKAMDLQEFVDTLYPDECAERTFLLLKLQDKSDE